MTTTTAASTPPFAGRRVLILALILGAVAAGLIVAYLGSRDTRTETPAAGTTIQVVVATREIPVGTKVDATMVQLKAIPLTAVIDDPFSRLEEVIGTVTRYPVQANEQVARGRLVDAAKGTSISFQIPAGLRGFTIPVNDNASPAGLLAPGDFVDIIVADNVKNIVPASGTPIPASVTLDYKAAVTLLQNVQVISVQRYYVNNGIVYDSTTRGAATGDKSVNNVTLAVTPEQAQLLWLATQEGKLTLSLRPFGDNTVTELAPIAEPVRLK
jgi:pilus assembly protein CpaB